MELKNIDINDEKYNNIQLINLKNINIDIPYIVENKLSQNELLENFRKLKIKWLRNDFNKLNIFNILQIITRNFKININNLTEEMIENGKNRCLGEIFVIQHKFKDIELLTDPDNENIVYSNIFVVFSRKGTYPSVKRF